MSDLAARRRERLEHQVTARAAEELHCYKLLEAAVEESQRAHVGAHAAQAAYLDAVAARREARAALLADVLHVDLDFARKL